MLVLVAALAPPSTGHRWLVLLRVAAFIAGLGLAFLSGSRGQVLFALMCAMLFYPMSRRLKSLSNFVGVALGIVILVLGVAMVRSLFVGIENEERWSSESLVYGGEGRLENVMDLARAYASHPAFWPIGLGCLAFHDLPTTGGDPYSHVIIADIIFELGIPGVVLFSTILGIATWSAVKLFAMVSHDPQKRADVAFLAAFTFYEFMLANKAGQLWGQTGLFMGCCMLTRLALLEQENFVLVADDDEHVDDAAELDSDEYTPGRLVIS
jgi:hypothetical protein